MRRRSLCVALVAVTVALVLAACSGGQHSTAAPAPIKLALVTSVTGPAASDVGQSQQGFMARLDLQNAKGGVDGHRLVPVIVDDGISPPGGVATGVQRAIAQGVLGIVSVSGLFVFGSYKYAQQADIPVTGASFDGPEWGQQPNTNMFASDTGSINPKYPVNGLFADFIKSRGGSIVASYGLSISPSSSRSATSTARAATRDGLKVGILDTSVSYTQGDFTVEALAAKAKQVNAVYGSMDGTQTVDLVQSFKNAGVGIKVYALPSGYDPRLIHSTAWNALQGAYFETSFQPTVLPNSGTKTLVSALQKYQHRPPSMFPTDFVDEGWLGADLMIKGFQLDGPNPTRAGVIKDLRNLHSYNGDGLLPVTIDYSSVFGRGVQPQCAWFMQVAKNGFVPVSTKPFCGRNIPGTSTVSSS